MNHPSPPYPVAMEARFYEELEKLETGIVNCHAHLDRAYTAKGKVLDQVNAWMSEKWTLMREIKSEYIKNPKELEERLSKTIDYFIAQGLIACRTHIDADPFVGTVAMSTAAKVREKYADRFTLQLVSHPLEGFFNEDFTEISKEKIDLFEECSSIADVVGGLPSKDRPADNGPSKHADILFDIAKNLGKPLDIHSDQENNPDEKDTDWLLDKVEEHKQEGNFSFLHCLSTSCRTVHERNNLYKRMVDLGVSVAVSPRAVLDMKQFKEKTAPIHNSIFQVDEALEAGVTVGVGTDNISDIYCPEISGSLWEEISAMITACRIYDGVALAKVASTNGIKMLRLTPEQVAKAQQYQQKRQKGLSPLSSRPERSGAKGSLNQESKTQAKS